MTIEIWTLVGIVITSLFGGGFITGVLNWRTSSKQAVNEDERSSENDATSRMRSIVDAQFESLVKPLQEDVSRLRSDVDALKRQLEEQRTRYWKAIGFARTLLYWIDRTFGAHGHEVPTPPAEVREDIEIG